MFRVMKHPPQSPDMNPIELLWDELDRKLREDPPTSKSDLLKKLQIYWRDISPEAIKKLIDRMPKVMRAVKKARGGHIDEKKL